MRRPLLSVERKLKTKKIIFNLPKVDKNSKLNRPLFQVDTPKTLFKEIQP